MKDSPKKRNTYSIDVEKQVSKNMKIVGRYIFISMLIALLAIVSTLYLTDIKITNLKTELKSRDSIITSIQQENYYLKYLDTLGFSESRNRYNIANEYFCYGRWQININVLKRIGMTVNKDSFLTSPDLQYEAVNLMLYYNRTKLNDYIRMVEDSTMYIDSVRITESGILAAAHLAGYPNVIKFFKKGTNFRDANGTSIRRYMKAFSGYDVSFLKKLHYDCIN